MKFRRTMLGLFAALAVFGGATTSTADPNGNNCNGELHRQIAGPGVGVGLMSFYARSEPGGEQQLKELVCP
jgi:hypothetical protein